MSFLKKILLKNNSMTEKQFIEAEIAAWKKSRKRKEQIDGEKYYEYDQKINQRKRKAIGKDGMLVEVNNLPNNLVTHNEYANMVDQKNNYLLGKPITIDTEDKQYEDELRTIMNPKFRNKVRIVGRHSLTGAIGWLFPYVDFKGDLKFKIFKPYTILPLWKDAEHTELDIVLRVYEVESYEGTKLVIIEKVEVYKIEHIECYILRNGKLVPDAIPIKHYLTLEYEDEETGENKVAPYNWGRIPLIPFKFNDSEIPLLRKCRSLQDGINIMLSDFLNIMQENTGSAILVLKNYEGENLGEFRQKLMELRAVKVGTRDGKEGGVETLEIEVNAENYNIILKLLKQCLIENCKGYDSKDDRLSGNPNQLNIQSMYSDIDIDANGTEMEYQSSLQELKEIIDIYLLNKTGKDYKNTEVSFILNRDMLMNESEIIDSVVKESTLVSKETAISHLPWIDDVPKELERLAKEKQEEIDNYNNTFPKDNPNTSNGGEGDE